MVTMAEFPCILRHFRQKSRKKYEKIFDKLIDYMLGICYNITISCNYDANLPPKSRFGGDLKMKNNGTEDENLAFFTIFIIKMKKN